MGAGGSAVSYTLFAEYAPTEFRGKALVIEQSFWSIGSITAVLVAWIVLPTWGWRAFLGASAIPSWIVLCFYRYIPESVRYLQTLGDDEGSNAIIQRISEVNNAPLPEGRLKVDFQVVDKSERGAVSLIFVPAYRYVSILLLIIFWTETFCYYGISIITPRYFKGDSLYTSSLIATCGEIPGIIVAYFYLDQIGRKNFLICGYSLFIVSTYLMAAFSSIPEVAMFVSFFSRMAINSCFMVLFVFYSEYYPTVVRAIALGAGSAVGRIGGLCTNYVAENTNISVEIALTIYATTAIIALVCSILLPIDTTGREMRNSIDYSSAVDMHADFEFSTVSDVELQTVDSEPKGEIMSA